MDIGTKPLGKTTSFNLIVNGSPITVTCSASPSPALMGQNVTWTGVVSGGIPPYTYSWSGTNIPTSPAPTSNPYTKSYGTIGQKTATLTVRDSDNTTGSCGGGGGGSVGSVYINFNPSFQEF